MENKEKNNTLLDFSKINSQLNSNLNYLANNDIQETKEEIPKLEITLVIKTKITTRKDLSQMKNNKDNKEEEVNNQQYNEKKDESKVKNSSLQINDFGSKSKQKEKTNFKIVNIILNIYNPKVGMIIHL